ncbi:MAG: DUF535 family protein [Burkholderiales bacterium]|nr:DUF535 family protein [Burkholderiales bacterium]
MPAGPTRRLYGTDQIIASRICPLDGWTWFATQQTRPCGLARLPALATVHLGGSVAIRQTCRMLRSQTESAMGHAQLQWTDVTAPPRKLSGRLDALKRLLQASTYVRPGTKPIGWVRIATHFMRCTAHLDTFRNWFGNPRHAALQEALLRRPTLVNCVVHPYLNADWPATRKLEVIAGHYAMLGGRLGFLRFAANEVVELGCTDEGLHIRLKSPPVMNTRARSTSACSAPRHACTHWCSPCRNRASAEWPTSVHCKACTVTRPSRSTAD